MFSKSCPKVSAGQVLKVGGLEVAAFDPVYCSLPPLRALCPWPSSLSVYVQRVCSAQSPHSCGLVIVQVVRLLVLLVIPGVGNRKIGKSDLIDVFDCIDQSVEIDDTLVSFIDLSRFYRFHRFIYRKIHLFFCSSKNENWFHPNSEFVDNWVAIESRIKDQPIYHHFFFFGFPLEPGLKSSLMADIGRVGKCPVLHDKICHRFKITSIPPVHSYFPE